MKVILYMEITANGYVAGEDDNVDWVSEEAWESYQEKIKEIGNAIIGRKTYDLMPEEEFVENCSFVIVSKGKNKEKKTEDLTFASSPKEALKVLKKKGFKKAFLAGGTQLNSSFLKEGLIDEMYLDVHPKILTSGTPLFDIKGQDLNLKLLETKNLSKNVLQLHYKVKE